MKIVTLTTLYPNLIQENHGVFVENRLRHLLDSQKVEAQVVAPVPWFPLSNKYFGEYAKFAKIPKTEFRNNIYVAHPRFPVIPKIGMSIAPFLLAINLYPFLKKIKRKFPFDLIDAHYFYPDGVAAVLLGIALGKPVVITARGSDLNLIPNYSVPRKLIVWASMKANGIIAVSQSLKNVLNGMGVPSAKVTVLRNGVDLNIFCPPTDRRILRESLNVIGPLILTVGRLDTNKGHILVIEALLKISKANLFIAGDGPERKNLQNSVTRLGLEGRVNFLGAIPHHKLSQYYGAADVFVLASDREGWPNVLLESMACGTPVVATSVGGAPEVIHDPVAGLLVGTRNAGEIALTIERLLENLPERNNTRKYAEKFSWDETSMGQFELFRQILTRNQRA